MQCVYLRTGPGVLTMEGSGTLTRRRIAYLEKPHALLDSTLRPLDQSSSISLVYAENLVCRWFTMISPVSSIIYV